jgi:hypothetical protein
LDDDALLQAFESCTLPPAALGHREHVRIAWIILRAHPRFEDGAQRFCAGLRRFAEAHGKTGLYHETITWAYLVLVNARMQPAGASFDDFSAENPDLLEPGLAALLPFYARDVLQSEPARAAFLLPGAPAHSAAPARANQAPTSTQAFCPSMSPSTETTITSASTRST